MSGLFNNDYDSLFVNDYDKIFIGEYKTTPMYDVKYKTINPYMNITREPKTKKEFEKTKIPRQKVLLKDKRGFQGKEFSGEKFSDILKKSHIEFYEKRRLKNFAIDKYF